MTSQTWMMLAGVAMLLAAVGITAYQLSRGARPKARSAPRPRLGPAAHGLKPAEGFPTFAYNVAWLAVRHERAADVAEALGWAGRDARWAEGLRGLAQIGAYVTPPVRGWVFAVSSDAFSSARTAREALTRVSVALDTEAQLFVSYRQAGYFAWGRAVQGDVLRFRWQDAEDPAPIQDGVADAFEEKLLEAAIERIEDSGPITVRERRGERGRPRPGREERHSHWAGQDEVLAMAEAWSVNPRKIRPVQVPAAPGVLVPRLPG